MTANTHRNPGVSVPDSMSDPESLRGSDGVRFETDTDVVDAELFEEIVELADLACVGLTNERGEVLLRKLTPDCSWKLPCQGVAPEEDFVAAAEETLAEQVGPDATLEAVTSCWVFTARVEDGERSTTRRFAVFQAVPAAETPSDVDPGGEAVADAGWFREPPSDEGGLPGSGWFFE